MPGLFPDYQHIDAGHGPQSAVWVNIFLHIMGYFFPLQCINPRTPTTKIAHMVTKTYYKTKEYCKVKFTFKVDNAETVEILGLNSDWENSIVMSRRKDGTFSCEVPLPKNSEHEFKYRINEQLWMNEPEADSEKPNEFGTSNSVIVV